MKYLLFFTALIATANALDCECSGQTCATNPCTVDAGKCYSIQREISTVKNKTLTATIKGCQDPKVQPDLCKQGFALTSFGNELYMISNISCCDDKPSCNKDITPALNKDIPNSNLVCPSCFTLTKTCDAKLVKCNNLQKKCFNMTGTVTKGSAAAQEFIARGCAVENTIFTKDVTLTFGDTAYKIQEVQLQDAKSGASQISSCLSFAILLPSVLWFLLDRSLY